MVVKSVLQGISGLPHVLYRPALSAVNKVYNVIQRADQVVPGGECLFDFDTAEGGGLLQMFFADDAFFRTLEASLCFLVLFWLMWLQCRGFGQHQRLSQVVAIPFTHDRWQWHYLSHS